ncbi:cytochrome P450 [Crassisporium funariophilum]|nr:cytochrome P450 [Crassisporium funariophilum]
MLVVILRTAALCAVSWALWRILQSFVVKSALDNLPGPPSLSLFKGVFPQVFNINAWDFHKQIAEKYGSVIKIKAMLGENQLYVFDPKALHHIVVKDQYIYEETSAFIEMNRLTFGPGLLGTLGDHHRKQRKMLNPVFSIAHMREMIPTFYNVSYKLRDAFAHRARNGPQEIDVLSWMTRTALELIGQSGLGYSFDPLTEDGVPHPYSVSAKQLVPVLFQLIFARTYFLSTSVKIGTPRLRRFFVNLLPWKALHEIRDIVDVLHNTSLEIFESKKKALEEGDEAVSKQIGQGKDIMSILMRANIDASEEDRLSKEEILGQMSTLTFAAMDTTSGALSRILHLLSTHPRVQDKLREEIREARSKHGDMAYDELVALPYLDAVCRETLRLYPPVSVVSRTTRQDIVLPLSNPVRGLDGREMSEIPIPNNTNVIVSIIGSNRNPEIWGPDSYEWKPERWLTPLPDTVAGAHLPGVYSHLMTFLGGGRACIGFKFSQLEMKVVLLLLIESFKFSPSAKEIFWQMNAIATPTVKGGSSRSQMPMIVELVKPVA